MSSPPRRAILVIGGKNAPRSAAAANPAMAKWTPEAIAAAAAQQTAQLAAAGFDATAYLIDLATKDDDTVMEEITRLHDAQRWDGVVIAGGVRSSPEYTDLFEDLVNLLAGGQSPAPRFVFPSGPDRLYERVVRAFQDQGGVA